MSPGRALLRSPAGATLLFLGGWGAVNGIAVALPFGDPLAFSAPYPLFLLFLALYLGAAAGFSFLLTAAVIGARRSSLPLLCFLLLAGFAALVIWGKRQPGGSVILAVANTAVLLCGAAVAGALLSSAIKRVGELIPLCCTAAAADLVSVAKGPTSHMITEIASYYQGGMRGKAPLVDFFLVKAAMPGHELPVPLFGVTDWILVCLLAASLQRVGNTANLSAGQARRAPLSGLVAATAGLYAGLLVAGMTVRFVPAMVFISVTFLAFLALRFDLRRQMRRSDLIYTLVVPSCVGLLVVLVAP